jgi:ACR3 family arsenite efflux pump ArsB
MTDSLLGEYGAFIVPAYLLSIAVFVGLALMIGRRLRYWSVRAKRRDNEKDAQ